MSLCVKRHEWVRAEGRRARDATFLTHICKVMQPLNTVVMPSCGVPKEAFPRRLEEATRRPQSRVPFERGLGNRKIKFTECQQRDGNKNTFNSIGGECLLRRPLLAEMSAGGSKILREGLPRQPVVRRPPAPRRATRPLHDLILSS